MPVPAFCAASAFAALVGATQDCDYGDTASTTDVDNDNSAAIAVNAGNTATSRRDKKKKQQNGDTEVNKDRVNNDSNNTNGSTSDENDGSMGTPTALPAPNSLRSAGSATSQSAYTGPRNTTVTTVQSTSRSAIHDSRTLLSNPKSTRATGYSSLLPKNVDGGGVGSGFINGDFGSGQVHHLVLDEGDATFVHAYHPSTSSSSSLSLLAVGQFNSVALYDTVTYQLVCTLSTTCNGIHNSNSNKNNTSNKDLVSALQWLVVPTSDQPHRTILAATTKGGQLCIWAINPDLIEFQGAQLVYSSAFGNQIRALAMTVYETTKQCEQQWIAIFVGDKTGILNVITLEYYTLDCLASTIVHEYPCGILSVAVNSGAKSRDGCKSYILALSTVDGHVFAYNLQQNSSRAVVIDSDSIWHNLRKGPVHCVIFVKNGSVLAFGGYDKNVVLVDTRSWTIYRVLTLQGTVNTIAMDYSELYVAVGCRDKSLSLFDTSTFVQIKSFSFPGWVTSVSWRMTRGFHNVLSVRSERNCITILNLTSIKTTNVRLTSHIGNESSLSWSSDGYFLARTIGNKVVITNALDVEFPDVCNYTLKGAISDIKFCRCLPNQEMLACIDSSGYLTVLRLVSHLNMYSLELDQSIYVEPDLTALCWSLDAKFLVTSGKDKVLRVFTTESWKSFGDPISVFAKVWQIDFAPKSYASDTIHLAIALGDYTAVVLDRSYEKSLQVLRSRTVRCLKFHPVRPLLAIGDGSGVVAIVDLIEEEIIHEILIDGRVNVLEFSPVGDYLVVGADGGRFTFLETKSFCRVQEFTGNGFALRAKFSPNGSCISIAFSNEEFVLLRLGPFLCIDMIPLSLEGGVCQNLPRWALIEALYRSTDGPSLVQRHMLEGGLDNMQQLQAILRDHPSSVHAYNRITKEGCLDTALKSGKPNLLKLAITMLVDGTLEPKTTEHRSLLLSDIPRQGREALEVIVDTCPSDFIVEIMRSMIFTKVPFTSPHVVKLKRRIICGSESYTDPWSDKDSIKLHHRNPSQNLFQPIRRYTRDELVLTPAVLPLPGLGEMDFLLCLLNGALPSVFDNDAMGLVLAVMWTNHIQRYFIIDTLIFVVYLGSWIVFLETSKFGANRARFHSVAAKDITALLCFSLNTVFALKEIIQSRYGRRSTYFRSAWNVVDFTSIICVYIYVIEVDFLHKESREFIALAVVSTLLLSVKLLSYLRGFGDTGWLISVLAANINDVRGFLIILMVLLIGFSVSFSILFEDSSDLSFSSLRGSLLATFQLTIIGVYDPSILDSASNKTLAVFTFILAVTCVFVVSLNALISILADSYAKVQQNATANRRKEKANLIVEYMSILPPKYRRKVENETKWFHTLLEVDADGDLLVQKDDWEGGINSLRRDIAAMEESNREQSQKSISAIRADFDIKLASFRREIMDVLEDMAEDLGKIKQTQEQGGVTFSGKNVAKAVNVVKSIGRKGTSIFATENK